MEQSCRCTLVLILCLLLDINAEHDYFKYTGPNLTFTQNESFTQFYFLENASVQQVVNINISDGYFPKCCPPSYRYHTSERKCVATNQTSILEMMRVNTNLIKSGLRDCEVTVDHVVTLEEAAKSVGGGVILNYQNETFPLGKYCIDGVINKTKQVIIRTCYDKEYCSRKTGLRCLKKCCPDGEMYLYRECGPQPEHGFLTEPHRAIISNLTEIFAIFSQRRRCRLHRPNISEENVIISENGSLDIHLDGTWKTYPVNEEMYCFELGLAEPVTPYMLMCNNEQSPVKFTYSKIGMSLSCVCFLLTMVIYALLYKLEKIIHRIVFCYCLAQLIGFSALTYVQIKPQQTDLCRPFAFIIMFGFLAGFAWLNVMCFDMWRTLGSMETKVGDRNKTNLKKMFYYSLYAWSAPTIITLICYFENTYNLFPSYLHAHIGELYCILEQKVQLGNYGHTLFLIFPMTLVTIINIIFFVLTLRYIVEATDNIRQMSENTKKKKKRVLFALKKKTFMALKLFLIMGINWTFEIISSIIDFNTYSVTKYIEFAFDTFNCFQGVFVFLIFILKWQMIKSLLAKLKLVVVNSVNRSSSTESSSN